MRRETANIEGGGNGCADDSAAWWRWAPWRPWCSAPAPANNTPSGGGGTLEQPERTVVHHARRRARSWSARASTTSRSSTTRAASSPGFDVEIMDAIAQKLGLKLEWKKANFDTIFTALAAGQFDAVAAASTIKPDRLQVVDFSRPVLQRAAVADGEHDEDAGRHDHRPAAVRRVVGVQKGTTGKDWAEAEPGAQGHPDQDLHERPGRVHRPRGRAASRASSTTSPAPRPRSRAGPT